MLRIKAPRCGCLFAACFSGIIIHGNYYRALVVAAMAFEIIKISHNSRTKLYFANQRM